MNSRVRVTALPALVATAFGISTLKGVMAQGAAKPTGFEELNLVVEEAGVTGMPASLASGRYLVNVTGPAPTEMGPSAAVFAQLPEGLTPEQALEDVMAAEDGPPPWYLEAHFGGGVILSQGTEGWAILDFTPGKWMVTTAFGSTLPVEFEATGEWPADVAAVEASVTIEFMEFGFKIADGALVAGDNLITLYNRGAQLHFLDLSMVPDGTTKEQVEGVMQSFMTGTPPADDGLGEDDFVSIAYLSDISPGVSESLPLTLEAGTYFLACWVPDFASGVPHAMMGMWDLVVVE